jgi:hypothetical protein
VLIVQIQLIWTKFRLMLGQAKIISPPFFPPHQNSNRLSPFFRFSFGTGETPLAYERKKQFFSFRLKSQNVSSIALYSWAAQRLENFILFRLLCFSLNASVRCVDTTPSTVQPLSPFRLDKFKNILYYKKCLIL